MKQTCSNQLTDELVTATEKTTTIQLVRSNQLRTRATQTAASFAILPLKMKRPRLILWEVYRESVPWQG